MFIPFTNMNTISPFELYFDPGSSGFILGSKNVKVTIEQIITKIKLNSEEINA